MGYLALVVLVSIFCLENVIDNWREFMARTKRIIWPFIRGFDRLSLLALLYFGIVWAESPQHALELFWEDRWIVIPIILGFWRCKRRFTSFLKKRLFVPVTMLVPAAL